MRLIRRALGLAPAALTACTTPRRERVELLICGGFVLPFDRLLDITRTVPSASANLTVTTTVARWEGELDEEVDRARPQT